MMVGFLACEKAVATTKSPHTIIDIIRFIVFLFEEFVGLMNLLVLPVYKFAVFAGWRMRHAASLQVWNPVS
jgi:hypothetical protein